MNLPLATSSSLLGHVRERGGCDQDNSLGKAKKRSPACLLCYWQDKSFPNESRRVPAILSSRSLSLALSLPLSTHTHTLPNLRNANLCTFFFNLDSYHFYKIGGKWLPFDRNIRKRKIQDTALSLKIVQMKR